MGMVNLLKAFLGDDRGSEATEYALVLGMMALSAVIGITSSGGSANAWWNVVSAEVSSLTRG
jgi:Flp pilus assembly pilin Flp